MRVLVYASSSRTTPDRFLDLATSLGKKLAEEGHTCVNGGGRTGCMGALNQACKDAGGKVVCVIHEKWVVDGEKFDFADEMLITRGGDLSERKSKLLENADCVISLPGGLGTFDEIMDVACRKQLGFVPEIPICVINARGFFDGLMSQIRRAVEEGLISLEKADTVHAEETAETALDWCTSQHKIARADPSQLNDDAVVPPPSVLEKEEESYVTSTLTILRNLAFLPPILFVYSWMFMQTISMFMKLSGEEAK